MSKRLAVLIAIAILFAVVAGSPAQARAEHPYTVVDPGTFGGPESFLNLPAVPLTKHGMLLGTADTTIPDADYPNFNPFMVGFPDQHLVHAFAWHGGQLRDLGALPGNNSSAVFEVNGHGIGVGMSETTATDPFTGWPADNAVMFNDGEVTDLGTLPGGYESQATDINGRGQVAGFASNGIHDQFTSIFFGPGTAWSTQLRSFIWQNGAMRDIGSLGGPDAAMTTLNARGQITGSSFTSSTANPSTGVPTLDPFLWTSGHMEDLGTLGGTLGFANWLNDAGEVVGSSDLAGDHTSHPFLWNGQRMLDLGTLGGDFGSANWVNDAGDVVGYAAPRDNNTAHAFVWKHGAMTDLTGAGSSQCTVASAINAHDEIVGSTCEESDALLWADGKQYDLNTLIAPSVLRLTTAAYINDQGEIVGHGVLPNGDQRVFLLLPNPSGTLPLRLAASNPANALPPATRSRHMAREGAAARLMRALRTGHTPGQLASAFMNARVTGRVWMNTRPLGITFAGDR
jgi:probable HAF family extracellular repeat protein